MDRWIVLGLSLISILACQKNPMADTDTEATSASNVNLQVDYVNANAANYQLKGAAGTYDIILTTRNLTQSLAAASTTPVYNSLDIATIQGTLTTYKKLSLKPFRGVFVPGRDGQPATVLANSTATVGDRLCSVLAVKVDMTTESLLAIEFSSVISADQIVAVGAIPHSANVNPCDPTLPAPVINNGNNSTIVATVSYSQQIAPAIGANCTSCHSNFNTYQGVRSSVWAYDSSRSGLYKALVGKMSNYAPVGLADLVKTWINEGALNN